MATFKKIKIKPLYKAKGNGGCIASNRITVDGQRVGYMYRELGDSSFPDSGWRFFAGDEDEEYTDNPDNFHIFDLNTICNYDHSIMEFLDSPFGSAYIRKNGRLIPDGLSAGQSDKDEVN